jgi:hypothetical protein
MNQKCKIEQFMALFEFCYMEKMQGTYRDMVEEAFLPSELSRWVTPILHILPSLEQYCSLSIYANKQCACLQPQSQNIN